MTQGANLLALGLIAGAGLMAASAARANVGAMGGEDGADTASNWMDMIDKNNPFAVGNRIEAANEATGRNVRAFLAMLRFSEGTDKATNAYAVCYGYRHTITQFSDHPAIAEGWKGEPLDSLGAAYRGKVSTAAGAYQIIRPTWQSAKRALALPDFTPASQDAAAVWLIDKRGALDLIKAGRFKDAIGKLGGEWASLPTSTAGQPTRRLQDLQASYTRAGGAMA
jgi:muramidase (phage lysozyme)